MNTEHDNDENNQYEENIDLAEGENTSMPIMSVMNIFNIYYNKKNKKNGNLFSGTNPFNKHSINNRMIEFMEEIRVFKLIKDPTVSEDINEFSSSHNLFCLKISSMDSITDDENNEHSAKNSIMGSIIEDEEYNEQNSTIYYSNNIIPLMLYLSEFNWTNINWEINALKDNSNK